jgi:hypothetical protein
MAYTHLAHGAAPALLRKCSNLSNHSIGRIQGNHSNRFPLKIVSFHQQYSERLGAMKMRSLKGIWKLCAL